MGYMQEVDRWLDTVLAGLEPQRLPEAKRLIRAKILESYRNGQATAGRAESVADSKGQNQKPPHRHGR